jgi:hypothetical protein
MKAKFLGAMTLALLIILVFAVVAQAAVPQSVIDAIIKDAQDGTIDGNWTAAEIRAALAYIQNNPILLSRDVSLPRCTVHRASTDGSFPGYPVPQGSGAAPQGAAKPHLFIEWGSQVSGISHPWTLHLSALLHVRHSPG